MSKLLSLYSRSFERRPLLTLALTNGCLMALGDFSAQALATPALNATLPPYDYLRTARFLTYGAAWGPLSGMWNKKLEVDYPLRPIELPSSPVELASVKIMNSTPGIGGPRPVKGPGEVSIAALAKRVALDQLFMAPISLFLFLATMGFLEGLDLEEIWLKVTSNYFPIILVGLQIWPMWQLFVFRYVPLRYRIPVGALAGIGWSMYLSTRVEAPVAVAE